MLLHIVSGRGRGRTYVLQFYILFEVLSLFAVFILVKMKFFPIHFNPPMFEQTEGIEPSLTLRGGRASTALHLHLYPTLDSNQTLSFCVLSSCNRALALVIER